MQIAIFIPKWVYNMDKDAAKLSSFLLALSLNGKKKNIKRKDFLEAMSRLDIDNRSIDNIFTKFHKSLDKWYDFIGISFIPDAMKSSY